MIEFLVIFNKKHITHVAHLKFASYVVSTQLIRQ